MEYAERLLGGPTGMSNLGRVDPNKVISGGCPCPDCKKERTSGKGVS